MVRHLIPALLISAVAFSSCSSLKPLHSGNQVIATPVRTSTNSSVANGSDIEFLDDISMTPKTASARPEKILNKRETVSGNRGYTTETRATKSSIEKATPLQLKYAVLLNTDVELLQNNSLLEHVDEWYGTRYRMGGTTKKGIDCSAFVQTVYLSAFGVSLPRTAREQYRASRIISATELKEGDLVFFNTTGGISHVGIYLMNNKFIHASSSQGVTVSDMFDPYYLKHYIGAGRIAKPEVSVR